MKLSQSMISYALAVLLFIISNGPLYAKDSCDDGQPYADVSIVQLAPKIEEQHSQSAGSYIYHRYSTMVEFELGQRVFLTSEEFDGKNIRSDDVGRLRNLTTGQKWSHDFRSPDRTRIVDIPPQDVTALFEPGTNIIELELEDVMPGFYSSWPYYLVVKAPCGAKNTPATPTITSTPTVPPTSAATATMTPSPSATATDTSVPTLTATPSPIPPTETATASATPSATATATVSPTTDTALFVPVVTPPTTGAAPDDIQPSSNSTWRTIVGLLGLAAVMFGLIAWILSRKKQIRIPGTLEIYQQGQFVRLVDLAMFSQDWITFGPVGDILLPNTAGDVTAQARLSYEIDELGDGEVIVEVPASDDEGEWLPLRSLKHGDTFTIGKYTLKYINLTEQSLEWEGGYAHASS